MLGRGLSFSADDHFCETASFAHNQNFSAAGLSRPFSAAMPTEIGFGSVPRTSDC